MNRYWVEASDISMNSDIYYDVAAETAQEAVDMVRAKDNILVTRVFIETKAWE